MSNVVKNAIPRTLLILARIGDESWICIDMNYDYIMTITMIWNSDKLERRLAPASPAIDELLVIHRYPTEPHYLLQQVLPKMPWGGCTSGSRKDCLMPGLWKVCGPVLLMEKGWLKQKPEKVTKEKLWQLLSHFLKIWKEVFIRSLVRCRSLGRARC